MQNNNSGNLLKMKFVHASNKSFIKHCTGANKRSPSFVFNLNGKFSVQVSHIMYISKIKSDNNDDCNISTNENQ